MAALFLLDLGPMHPPTQQEIAVATANRMLNNATPGPAIIDIHDGNGEESENTDPLFRNQQVAELNRPPSKT